MHLASTTKASMLLTEKTVACTIASESIDQRTGAYDTKILNQHAARPDRRNQYESLGLLMRKLLCLLNLLAGLCLCSDAFANTNDAGSFFLLGVEHIATGFDHLLFLLALILCGGSLVALIKIITAFTIAHSVTLAAAALGLVNLPSTLVESVIALSIAYVAFENLFPRYAISRRWTISFLFGLMHGFGFSSVLKEIGLPHDTLLWSLLNFNLGVETGQLLAVAIVLPGLLWLRTTRWEKPVVDTLSALVLVVGVALFVQRLL